LAAGSEFIAAQKLKLRDKAVVRLRQSLVLYNYYTDNCSTLVRDVIDERAVGRFTPHSPIK